MSSELRITIDQSEIVSELRALRAVMDDILIELRSRQTKTVKPAPAPTWKPPLARRDAAKALGLSISTIDRLITKGDLVAKKFGQRVLVPAEEIERYQSRAPAATVQ
jgi:excisionase family DNA binding protein